MIDKNGNALVVGNTVTDGHGLIGEIVVVSETEMVKFEFKGEERYTPMNKLQSNQIEKVVV